MPCGCVRRKESHTSTTHACSSGARMIVHALSPSLESSIVHVVHVCQISISQPRTGHMICGRGGSEKGSVAHSCENQKSNCSSAGRSQDTATRGVLGWLCVLTQFAGASGSETEDQLFYDTPKLVQHIEEPAVKAANKVISSTIAPEPQCSRGRRHSKSSHRKPG